MELIDADLIECASKDVNLTKIIKNITINHFLIKKIHHLAWHIFHSFSVMYPDHPTEEEQLRTKQFISNITTKLSFVCSSCSKKKETFIEEYDLTMAVSSKLHLVQFFCEYHKKINNRVHVDYESDNFTVSFIINRYTTKDYISFIENTYHLNLYTLFQQNTMDTFFQLFHNVTSQIYKTEGLKYDFKLTFVA